MPPQCPHLRRPGDSSWIRRNRRAKWMPPGSERTRALAVRTTHFFNSSLSTPDPVPARESSKHPLERHRTQDHEKPSKISHGGNFIFLAERSKQIAAFEFVSRSSRLRVNPWRISLPLRVSVPLWLIRVPRHPNSRGL